MAGERLPRAVVVVRHHVEDVQVPVVEQDVWHVRRIVHCYGVLPDSGAMHYLFSLTILLPLITNQIQFMNCSLKKEQDTLLLVSYFIVFNCIAVLIKYHIHSDILMYMITRLIYFVEVN